MPTALASFDLAREANSDDLNHEWLFKINCHHCLLAQLTGIFFSNVISFYYICINTVIEIILISLYDNLAVSYYVLCYFFYRNEVHIKRILHIVKFH